jgi:SSS family solute:Na+ symporter
MFGLDTIDIVMILLYFMAILWIGIKAMGKVHTQEDYFLGARSFGKLVQTFAHYGQAVSSDSAVSVSTLTFRSGVSGAFLSLFSLLCTPIFWMTGPWYRRMRVTTMADFYVERYQSKGLALVYALFFSAWFAIGIALSFVAVQKTVQAMTPVPESEYAQAQKEEVVLYRELQALSSRDYSVLSEGDKARLQELRLQNPRGSFSHIDGTFLVILLAIIVVAYTTTGGLRAAFLTDVLQGFFMLMFTIILIPFAIAATNRAFGGSGTWGAFHSLHLELPSHVFDLFGSSAASTFTWYYALAVTAMLLFTIIIHPSSMSAYAAAKDEFTTRTGSLIGIYLKRYSYIPWSLAALFAMLLFADQVSDPDLAWGVASRELLGPLGIGLVGLMIAALLAAMMSSVDAHLVNCSALVNRNVYQLFFPHKSEGHYLGVARIAGICVVATAVYVAISLDDIFSQLKLHWEFPLVFASTFWLGMGWRKANRISAWITVVFSLVLFIVIPVFLAVVIPGLRTDPNFLVRTDPKPIVREYIANQGDVEERLAEIAAWSRMQEEGESDEPRPRALQVGERFTKTYQPAGVSIYWTQGIQTDEKGQPRGSGLFNEEMLALGWLGVDLSKLSNAMIETIRILFRILFSFLAMFVISFVTKRDSETLLDRFYVRMKTIAVADKEKDRRELEESYLNPNRFEHMKVFPNSEWELNRWNKQDILGFLLSCSLMAGVIVVMVLVVSYGAE